MTVFARGRWSIAIASVLAIVAMFLYPGGTGIDPTTRHYSLTRNFLSDLGTTTAWNGENNPGTALFVIALVTLVAGLGGVLVALVRMFWRAPRARTATVFAAILGAAVCLSFIGVAVMPYNSRTAAHIWFTFTAFRIFPFAVIMLGVASARSGLFSRRATIAWAVLAVELLLYLALLTWGPRADTPSGLPVQVIGQKAITIGALLTLIALTMEGDRAIRTTNP